MSEISSLFVTRLYRAALSEHAPAIDAGELAASCYSIAGDDEAGQEWCETEGYPGYTSYASLTDLPWRFPIFADLVKVLDAHVADFARDLEFDLDGRALTLEDIWINILARGGQPWQPYPSALGDFRHDLVWRCPRAPARSSSRTRARRGMMVAPPRRKAAREDMRTFVYVKPQVGDVLMWESWLRHEVPMNQSEDDRISVSFNYNWG